MSTMMLIVLIYSCTKDDKQIIIDPNSEEQLVSIDSYLIAEINDQILDCLKLDCKNSIQSNPLTTQEI
jgi:hypothetical protein